MKLCNKANRSGKVCDQPAGHIHLCAFRRVVPATREERDVVYRLAAAMFKDATDGRLDDLVIGVLRPAVGAVLGDDSPAAPGEDADTLRHIADDIESGDGDWTWKSASAVALRRIASRLRAPQGSEPEEETGATKPLGTAAKTDRRKG